MNDFVGLKKGLQGQQVSVKVFSKQEASYPLSKSFKRFELSLEIHNDHWGWEQTVDTWISWQISRPGKLRLFIRRYKSFSATSSRVEAQGFACCCCGFPFARKVALTEVVAYDITLISSSHVIRCLIADVSHHVTQKSGNLPNGATQNHLLTQYRRNIASYPVMLNRVISRRIESYHSSQI